MEDQKERVRGAIMDTFRDWGGYWNISSKPPGTDPDVDENSWAIRVHSHPHVHGTLPADVVDAYLADPADEAAAARWAEELTPLFKAAKAEAG